jgi:hypothetical protein
MPYSKVLRRVRVTVARGAAALDQEFLCQSTKPALLLPSEAHPAIRQASVETILNPDADRLWAK